MKCTKCGWAFEGEAWQKVCKKCYALSKQAIPEENVSTGSEAGDKFLPSYTKDIFVALVNNDRKTVPTELMKLAKMLGRELYA